MNKTIVFRMFPQESHHNATFKFASKLKGEGYRIVYASNENMKAVIKENGFDFYLIEIKKDILIKPLNRKIIQKTFKIKALHFIKYFFGIGLVQSIRDIFIKRKYHIRQNRKILCNDYFKKLIEDLDPILLFLDGTYKYNALHLIKYKLPFVIVETTVSLIRNNMKPPLNSGLIPVKNNWFSKTKVFFSWLYYDFKNNTSSLIIPNPKRTIINLSKKLSFPVSFLDFKRYYFFGFKNIIEINTTIFEFDFPHIKMPYHFYVGPPKLIKRKDSVYDYLYHNCINKIKKDLKKIVYCSFGSMAWRYNKHELFLEKIIKSFINNKCFYLIICIEDENTRRILRNKYKYNHIYIFRKVPQIDLLLSGVDLMITHGGANSINECILTSTPMLIYPGSKGLDQVGNAARVVYHKLGLRGKYSDSISTISKKTNTIVNNNHYLKNLNKFNRKINYQNYITAKDFLMNVLNFKK